METRNAKDAGNVTENVNDVLWLRDGYTDVGVVLRAW